MKRRLLIAAGIFLVLFMVLVFLTDGGTLAPFIYSRL